VSSIHDGVVASCQAAASSGGSGGAGGGVDWQGLEFEAGSWQPAFDYLATHHPDEAWRSAAEQASGRLQELADRVARWACLRPPPPPPPAGAAAPPDGTGPRT